MELSSSENFLLKPLKITIFRPNLCKKGVPMCHTQQKTFFFFFSEITKPDYKLSKPFRFNKIPYVLAELWMFFYFVWCFFDKKCHFQSWQLCHKLIQQILGSHELNDHAHFGPDPPKNHWNNFLLSWICTTMQKCNQFILKIQPILESCDQTGHTHFWPRQSKNFLINF